MELVIFIKFSECTCDHVLLYGHMAVLAQMITMATQPKDCSRTYKTLNNTLRCTLLYKFTYMYMYVQHCEPP